MIADLVAEDRRIFTIAGWTSGVARTNELRWMRRLSLGAGHLLRYLLAKLKSHGRAAVSCRTTSYRAISYARSARVSRWTAWRRLRELVARGLIESLGGRESLKVLVRPPPGVEVTASGHAVRTPRAHRRKTCRPATKPPEKLGARLLPIELAQACAAGWPTGTKRAFYDWLHEAQNSSTPETRASSECVVPTQGLGRAHRMGEPQPRPLGNPLTDRRNPLLGLRTIGGAAEVTETPQTGLAGSQPSRSDSGPPRLELPQAQMARANDVADSRERPRNPRPTDGKRAKRDGRPPGDAAALTP